MGVDLRAQPLERAAAALIKQLADALIVADASGTIVVANSAADRLLGAVPETLVGRSILELVPERLQVAHRSAFARFVETGTGPLIGGRAIQVPARRCDGSEVEVELTLGATGRPGEPDFAVVATLRDVSHRVEMARQAGFSRYLQATVEASREGILAISPDRRVLAVNRRFIELWQLREDDVVVGGPSPALGGGTLDQVVDVSAFQAGIAWGHEHPHDSQLLDVPLKDGRVISGYAAPVLDPEGGYLGRVWYCWDDTARRAAEADRERLLEQLDAARRTQQFLLDASAVLAHVTGYVETLRALAAVAVPRLGDLCLIDVVDESGRISRLAAVHADPARQALVDELRRLHQPDPGGQHPSVEVMRTRRSRWSPEMPDEFLRATTRGERHYEIVKELGFASYMVVPLVAEQQVLGSITLVSAGSGRHFGPDDVALAEELASRVALVVAKERRYDAERRTSHALQANLLSAETPPLAGVDVAVRYLPGTRDAEVGGDFWDVLEMPNGEIELAIGDVAGHDIVAAATMAQLRSACRALRARSQGPADLIRLLQGTWDHLGLDRIATAVFGRYNRATRQLRLASAGHPPPLIIDAERAWFPSLDPAAPLGAPATEPGSWVGTLHPDTAVIFYTDGLVEDRQRDIDEGAERLLQVVSSAPTRDPEQLADHILAGLSGDDRGDDVALLVARIRP